MPKEVGPGYIRFPYSVVIDGVLLSGTGGLTLVLSESLGFKAELERVETVTEIALVGASGTQTYKVRKGNASGTVIATITPTQASQGTQGTVLSASVAVADQTTARFNDTDTFSITRDASGTTITAGRLNLKLWFRQRLQARK